MPYIILISGLIIIYAALRKEIKNKNSSTFNDILRTNLDKNETEYIMEKLSLIEMRIEEIENSLVLINQESTQNKKKFLNRKFEIEHNEIEHISLVSESQNIIDENEKHSTEKNITSSSEDINNQVKNENYTVISENDTNKTIYELFDSGKSIDEIAEILRIGKGELLLRLGLRKQRK